MRGVNLNVFDFDYDLTWAAFFLNADEKIYGRYGGRDAGEADAHLTLAGLKHAMREALAAYRRDPKARPPGGTKAVRTVEQYPAARRLKEGACIHCHQVYDFRREALRAAGEWRRAMVWVYPPPENVGLTVDVDQGDRVRSVAAGSAASRAGLRAGDTLQSVNRMPVASFADVQYALHHAPAAGEVPVSWKRGAKRMRGTLALEEGWRKSDISWRASMWGLEPAPGVHGQDLTAKEKTALGLPADRMAFRQGSFVTKQARAAGIRKDDIILGIDDRPLSMTMLQFNAFVRLNYNVGDRITFNILRDGQRIDLPMVLLARDTF